MRLAIFFIFNFFYFSFFGQNTTINKKDKTERETSSSHKVMLIPFEPK